MWRFTGECFEADDLDVAMATRGIGFDPSCLRDEWLALVAQVFTDATLNPTDAGAWMHRGGKRGVHTEHLSRLLAEMQVLPRAHPGASW